MGMSGSASFPQGWILPPGDASLFVVGTNGRIHRSPGTYASNYQAILALHSKKI
jgi:hypothetical protein